MKRNSFYSGKRAGIGVGVVIFVLALISIIVGGLALSGKVSLGSSANEAAKMNAATALQQATNLKDGFDRAVVGGLAASQVVFDLTTLTTANNLFHPTTGTAVPQTPPDTAFSTTVVAADKHWFYNKTVKIKSIGVDANADYAFVLPDVSLATCQQVNKALYGLSANLDPADATFPVSTGSLSDWKTGSVDDSASATMSGKAELCVKTSDGAYVLYKVAAQN